MVWIKAVLELADADVERETEFWSGVVGGPLPPHLVVQVQQPPRDRAGPFGIKVVLEPDSPVPEVPAPAAFPGVRRSRVYQVCLDVPHDDWDDVTDVWTRSTGGHLEVLPRRPEFAWMRIPGGRRPMDLLMQRLDTVDGSTRAHLDVGTSDREAEVRRHLALGATLVADEEFWTVLTDPLGFPYCVTDRDPATGELTG